MILKVIINKYLKFLHPRFFDEWMNRNKRIFNDPKRPVQEYQVNLCWAGMREGKITEHENLGDYLALVITNEILRENGHSLQDRVTKTTFLYTIGSIVGRGYHDATIWGSGLLKEKNALRCLKPKLDIRAIRGPKTRKILMNYGVQCPAIYGDGAVLLPRYYNPSLNKKWKYSLVLHHNSPQREKWLEESRLLGIHYIEIQTTDYKKFVDEIVQSEVVISSALHGIILSESYNVPAIFLKENLGQNIKFEDWFLATERPGYKYITDLNEVTKEKCNTLPDLEEMRERMLNTFPLDLWE